MLESDFYYFYLWRSCFVDSGTNQLVSRTCFGITKNINDRIKGYEGHVGHTVKFEHVWQGPERLIRELESRIKSDFFDEIFVGDSGYRYEWIKETVQFDSIVKWVNWEVSNTFIGISKQMLKEDA
jgi:hypothetical protein